MQKIVLGFLADMTGVLHEFLSEWLPKIGRDDWWDQNVIGFLSDSQVRMVTEKNISDLGGLD